MELADKMLMGLRALRAYDAVSNAYEALDNAESIKEQCEDVIGLAKAAYKATQKTPLERMMEKALDER